MILAGKTSRKIMITKRIAELKNVIEVNTQRLRSEALDRLKQLFNLASEIALGELKTINLQEGKRVRVFAEESDAEVLSVDTLEGLRLEVDPTTKQLRKIKALLAL